MVIRIHGKKTAAVLFLLAIVVLCSGCGDAGGGKAAETPAPRPLASAEAGKARAGGEPARVRSLPKPNLSVRGVYISSYALLNRKRMYETIQLLDKTELNAVVLDVNSGISLVAPSSKGDGAFSPSRKPPAELVRERIKELKRHRAYLIARIVTFNDPAHASARPEWTLHRKDGTVWRDRKGHAWMNPYLQETWRYPLALADHAAAIGFDEVQFDYVRFPENAAKTDREVAYHNPHGSRKSEAIGKFLREAKVRAHKAGVRMSADVFGMVGSTDTDMGIGQQWEVVAPEVDVISPMIYPSHYSEGIWGIAHPDLTPAPVIVKALRDATARNAKLSASGKVPAKVRPWLQSFTASWVHPHQKYGEAQIREQIRAARSAGYSSYLLWNSSCRYPLFQA